MYRKTLLILIVILLITAVISPGQPVYSSIGSGSDLNSPEGGDIEAAWQVEGIVRANDIPVDLAVENPVTALQNQLQSLIQTPGVDIKVRVATDQEGGKSFTYTLQGIGLRKLKQVIYKDLAEQLHNPSDPVDLQVEVSLDPGQTIEIVLGSNYSTGYRWLLDDAQRAAYRQVDDYALPQSSLNDGQSQKQTLRLTADAAVERITLAYRRAWEAAQAAVVITLQLSTFTPVLDLSSPLPAAAESQVQPAFTQLGPQPAAAPELLPAAFDWRDSQKVTPVRNQGGCGSCWAFGAVGVMESAMLIAGQGNPSTLDISEQYLLSCNTYGYNCQIGGFWPTHNHHYNRNGQYSNPPGAVLESEFPYIASNGSCIQVYNHPYLLTGWAYVQPGESVPSAALIKQAIYDHGPVGASVCVGSAFQGYQGGIFATDESGNCQTSNHAVLLVGWNDNNGDGYWILKNSWGSWWGESGFMRIRWGTSRIGIYANYVTYPAVSNPVPAITQLNPAQVYKGRTAFTLVVSGSGFVSSSKVRWNGADRTTAFISAGTLQAAIPASDVINPGTASVTVFNSAPGGGTSNSVAFLIIDPTVLEYKIHLPMISKK
jgi:C1A family cysteine protease